MTLPLPTGPRHVHCYFLRGDDGWTLVDTGLGLMETPWDEILAAARRPGRADLHHPHAPGPRRRRRGGRSRDRRAGVPGRLDYAQCERVWGADDWPERIAEWFLRHGVPPEVADELIESGHVFADFVRFAWNPTLVEPGDEVDGWRISDARAMQTATSSSCRDDVLIAGDTLLTPITPAIGLYPESRPDPLGDYLDSLRLVAELAPRISYGGHGDPVDDPAAAPCGIAAHHDERLDRTEAALGAEPRSRLRGLARPLRTRAGADPATFRRGRDAVPPRAARRRRAGRANEDDRSVTYTALARWWTTSLPVPSAPG